MLNVMTCTVKTKNEKTRRVMTGKKIAFTSMRYMLWEMSM